jgi:hypothetical protein
MFASPLYIVDYSGLRAAGHQNLQPRGNRRFEESSRVLSHRTEGDQFVHRVHAQDEFRVLTASRKPTCPANWWTPIVLPVALGLNASTEARSIFWRHPR